MVGVPLLILDAQGRSIGEVKPKNEWDNVNNKGSEANDRVLFNILNGACPHEFRRIANCKCAKETWDIL